MMMMQQADPLSASSPYYYNNYTPTTTSKSRIIGGTILLLVSMGLLVYMLTSLAPNSVCPANVNSIVCFFEYTLIVVLAGLGATVCCGWGGLLGACMCGQACAECGQLFVCCFVAADVVGGGDAY